MSKREQFLAGERHDDVLMYFTGDSLTDSGSDTLAEKGEAVDDGYVLVVEGEKGRGAFQAATGIDPLGFSKRASGTDGEIAAELTDATCPHEGEDDETHDLKFIFSFSEAQNEEVGGIYAEGDVVHAYAACTCGEAYSDKWHIGSR
jgi:hypothetical protein